MPVLSRGKIETVTLPASGAVLEISTRITAGVATKATSLGDDEVGGFLAILAELIRSWDFTDDEGQPVPVTEDALALLDIADFTFLAELVGAAVQNQVDSGKLSAPVKKS